MNHFDPDESNDWKDDIDAFEQQLRSLRPTPAAQSADSIAQSIESPLDQPAVVPTGNPASSFWQPIVSHSLTAAIGVAVGVAVMLARPSSDLFTTTDNANDQAFGTSAGD